MYDGLKIILQRCKFEYDPHWKPASGAARVDHQVVKICEAGRRRAPSTAQRVRNSREVNRQQRWFHARRKSGQPPDCLDAKRFSGLRSTMRDKLVFGRRYQGSILKERCETIIAKQT